jgi:hypothetical protein
MLAELVSKPDQVTAANGMAPNRQPGGLNVPLRAARSRAGEFGVIPAR